MALKTDNFINTTELGKAIKRRREELGLSLRDVADVTDVSASTLSRIENGTGKRSDQDMILNSPAAFDKGPPIDIADIRNKRIAFLDTKQVKATNKLIEAKYNASGDFFFAVSKNHRKTDFFTLHITTWIDSIDCSHAYRKMLPRWMHCANWVSTMCRVSTSAGRRASWPNARRASACRW